MGRGSSEWIVLIDSDVELCPDWTEKQIAFMEREGVDVACGKLVYASDPDTLNAAYGAMNRFTVCWNGGFGQPTASLDAPRRCLWAITAAVALRRSAVEAIGGFDEVMFAYYEDCDFGWRANLYGLRVAFNPEAVAFHRVHSTMNKQSMGSRITHLVFRNRIRAGLVNYQFHNVVRYVVPYLVLAGMDIFVRGHRRAKIDAFLWNLRNLRDTLRRRREVQKKRKILDRDLWNLFEAGIRGPGYDYE
jgi:GT2 family glycosyltransferase